MDEVFPQFFNIPSVSDSVKARASRHGDVIFSVYPNKPTKRQSLHPPARKPRYQEENTISRSDIEREIFLKNFRADVRSINES